MRKQLAAMTLVLAMAVSLITPVETVLAVETGASGYQVQYAANSTFTGAKTKKFTGSSVTLSGLSKKTWYFRVRTYKTTDDGPAYSPWSSAKKAAVKGASTITYKTSEFFDAFIRCHSKS